MSANVKSDRWFDFVMRQLEQETAEWNCIEEAKRFPVHRLLWERKIDRIRMYWSANNFAKGFLGRFDKIEPYCLADYFVAFDYSTHNVPLVRHRSGLNDIRICHTTGLDHWQLYPHKVSIEVPVQTVRPWLGLGEGNDPLRQCVQFAWDSGYRTYSDVVEFVHQRPLFTDSSELRIAHAWGFLLAALHPNDRKF